MRCARRRDWQDEIPIAPYDHKITNSEYIVHNVFQNTKLWSLHAAMNDKRLQFRIMFPSSWAELVQNSFAKN